MLDLDNERVKVDFYRTLVLGAPPPRYRVMWCSRLVVEPNFDSFIMLFILLNTFTLSAEHYNDRATGYAEGLGAVLYMGEIWAGMSFVDALEMCNHVFNTVFTLECFAKVLGMGFCNYLAIPFNCLDFFIVVTSAVGYLPGDALPGASAARLLRIFRLFRIAR